MENTPYFSDYIPNNNAFLQTRTDEVSMGRVNKLKGMAMEQLVIKHISSRIECNRGARLSNVLSEEQKKHYHDRLKEQYMVHRNFKIKDANGKEYLYISKHITEGDISDYHRVIFDIGDISKYEAYYVSFYEKKDMEQATRLGADGEVKYIFRCNSKGLPEGQECDYRGGFPKGVKMSRKKCPKCKTGNLGMETYKYDRYGDWERVLGYALAPRLIANGFIHNKNFDEMISFHSVDGWYVEEKPDGKKEVIIIESKNMEKTQVNFSANFQLLVYIKTLFHVLGDDNRGLLVYNGVFDPKMKYSLPHFNERFGVNIDFVELEEFLDGEGIGGIELFDLEKNPNAIPFGPRSRYGYVFREDITGVIMPKSNIGELRTDACLENDEPIELEGSHDECGGEEDVPSST